MHTFFLTALEHIDVTGKFYHINNAQEILSEEGNKFQHELDL